LCAFASGKHLSGLTSSEIAGPVSPQVFEPLKIW
jgi:hypothetical protein